MTERITADHLSRLAIVYVRQSSPGQVQNNRESTRRQYAMTERARAFGWPEQLIETIDGDLGMSGAVAGLRRGFDQLCRKVELGQVGAVFGIEMSRLSRNQVEWVHLVDLCCRTGTLIVEDSHVYTPGRNDDDLILGIKGAVNASELSIIKSRLLGGAAQQGSVESLYSIFRPATCWPVRTLVRIRTSRSGMRSSVYSALFRRRGRLVRRRNFCVTPGFAFRFAGLVACVGRRRTTAVFRPC